MITYPDAETYIEAKVTKNDLGCWLWNGFLAPNGYGHAKLFYKRQLAHRFSYETYKGKIPEGLQIDHLCKVRHCINPDHLEAVTSKENIARSDHASKKLAARTHCFKGHEYNEANTYIVKKKGIRIGRLCRQCHNEYEKARYVRIVQTRRLR